MPVLYVACVLVVARFLRTRPPRRSRRTRHSGDPSRCALHRLPARPTPNLSVGSRQLLRALLLSCVTKRGPEFTPETHPRAILTKSQSTPTASQHSSLTAVLCTRRSLAGPASVIKPTQHRCTKPNLKHVDGRRCLARGAFCRRVFQARRDLYLAHEFMHDDCR